MNIKCHQCGSEEAEKYHGFYDRNQFIEICFGCGYIRKITWFQMDVNGEIGKILDVLDDEKSKPEIKIKTIQEVLDQ